MPTKDTSRTFWQWLKDLFAPEPQLIAIAQDSEVSKRDTMLAFVYRDIRDNPNDWTYISYDRYDQLRKHKLESQHNHLFNKQAKIFIRAHFLADYNSSTYRDSCDINGEIKITIKEWKAFCGVIQTHTENLGYDRIIKQLQIRHEQKQSVYLQDIREQYPRLENRK